MASHALLSLVNEDAATATHSREEVSEPVTDSREAASESEMTQESTITNLYMERCSRERMPPP